MLLEDAKAWKCVVLFYDPVHQIHNSVAVNCWIETGNEFYLASNTWRKRLTALWAINPVDLKFSGLITEDNCDSEMTKATLWIIKSNYPENKPIYLILDNAAYNRSYEVQDYAESLGIKLYFLPAYSPNLNLIERLRKFMKKKLVNNRYYETYDEFYEAFISFFQDLKIYKDELLNFFTHKMQIIKAV